MMPYNLLTKQMQLSTRNQMIKRSKGIEFLNSFDGCNQVHIGSSVY